MPSAPSQRAFSPILDAYLLSLKNNIMDKEEIYYELHNDLFGRANVMIRQTINNQIVVIYDDHRWLLNVLFAASKYIERPILITFDAHDDAAKCEKYSNLLKK